jgi:hypothetical protein
MWCDFVAHSASIGTLVQKQRYAFGFALNSFFFMHFLAPGSFQNTGTQSCIDALSVEPEHESWQLFLHKTVCSCFCYRSFKQLLLSSSNTHTQKLSFAMRFPGSGKISSLHQVHCEHSAYKALEHILCNKNRMAPRSSETVVGLKGFQARWRLFLAYDLLETCHVYRMTTMRTLCQESYHLLPLSHGHRSRLMQHQHIPMTSKDMRFSPEALPSRITKPVRSLDSAMTLNESIHHPLN